MDEITEENPKKDEKKAFYVGLATVLGLIFIIAFAIFFLRGCADTKKDVEEVKNKGAKTEEAAKTATTPVATSDQGNVAGQKTETKTTPPANAKTYTVQSGDTLYEIGKKFKVDWHKIAEVNGIENSGALKVGKQIIIPSE
ncbi:MAG: LysM peptidoglycan-binding domain-containing protein [Candidatus Berkelbacteria bacterium]|nr:LysM peptidoglycan-binding domain-containing protein [Candidatus Berkelbacteria bacterium]